MTEERAPALRRELNVWEAVGISVALMAPSMAANINPQATVKSVGRAVPLAFALATVGVLLVSWTFVRLCRRFHHSGSVYGFVGATLGPRAGVVAGWGLLGTYTCYGVVTSMATGIFGTTFLASTGLWAHPPAWAPFLLGGLALVGVWALTISRVRLGTRVLLVAEGVTVLLILVVAVVVLARLGSGGHLTGTPFVVAPGTGVSNVFLGVVFGFLSFAGFEAAATLGEEARRPRRDIPRAILGTAIFGGAYYVLVTWVEVMGFGADSKGMAAFAKSGALMGDLGSRYVGAAVGDIISLGAAVSAFSCALASAVGGSRLLFALSRDGVGPKVLARVHPGRRTPVAASVAVVLAMYAIIAVTATVFGAAPFDVFVDSGTVGTLILLVAYVLATVGAMRLSFTGSGPGRVARWEVVVPVAALALLGYTVFANVWPYPSDPTTAAFWLPVACAVWLALAVVLVLVRPGIARRAGDRLTAEEGLAVQPM
jgi:amino acid transporter